jgi:hypothetical protein
MSGSIVFAMVKRGTQPEVNDFGYYSAFLLDTHHDVAWFDAHRTPTQLDRLPVFGRQQFKCSIVESPVPVRM